MTEAYTSHHQYVKPEAIVMKIVATASTKNVPIGRICIQRFDLVVVNPTIVIRRYRVSLASAIIDVSPAIAHCAVMKRCIIGS